MWNFLTIKSGLGRSDSVRGRRLSLQMSFKEQRYGVIEVF